MVGLKQQLWNQERDRRPAFSSRELSRGCLESARNGQECPQAAHYRCARATSARLTRSWRGRPGPESQSGSGESAGSSPRLSGVEGPAGPGAQAPAPADHQPPPGGAPEPGATVSARATNPKYAELGLRSARGKGSRDPAPQKPPRPWPRGPREFSLVSSHPSKEVKINKYVKSLKNVFLLLSLLRVVGCSQQNASHT